MGVYANVSIVAALLYFVCKKKALRNCRQQEWYKANRPTNFHQEASVVRPYEGRYYMPTRKMFYN